MLGQNIHFVVAMLLDAPEFFGPFDSSQRWPFSFFREVRVLDYELCRRFDAGAMGRKEERLAAR